MILQALHLKIIQISVYLCWLLGLYSPEAEMELFWLIADLADPIYPWTKLKQNQHRLIQLTPTTWLLPVRRVSLKWFICRKRRFPNLILNRHLLLLLLPPLPPPLHPLPVTMRSKYKCVKPYQGGKIILFDLNSKLGKILLGW